MKALNTRVIVMTVMFSLIFAVRAVHNLLYTWGLIPRFYPLMFNKVAWDTVFHMLYEFLPVVLIMIISKRDSTQRFVDSTPSINRLNKSEDQEEGSTGHHEEEDESDESFGNFNPNLKDHLLDRATTKKKGYY